MPVVCCRRQPFWPPVFVGSPCTVCGGGSLVLAVGFRMALHFAVVAGIRMACLFVCVSVETGLRVWNAISHACDACTVRLYEVVDVQAVVDDLVVDVLSDLVLNDL